MRCIIVDCWNLKGGRVEQLKRTLSQYAVQHIPQVSDESEDEWEATADSVRELLVGYDFVLLHVGDDQKFKLQTLQQICPSRPVFCYTGGSVQPDIEAHCQTPGFHVLCPGSFGRRDPGALPTAIIRWLDILGPNPSKESAVAAWQEVHHIDPAKEKRIQELDTRLVALLRQHNWTPASAVSDDLRAALKSWRNEMGGKW